MTVLLSLKSIFVFNFLWRKKKKLSWKVLVFGMA